MSKATWLIRFDAGPEIGLGHWYRCVALAEALERCGEGDVLLWTNPLAPLLMEAVRAKGLRVEASDRWNDPDYLVAHLNSFASPILVLDLMETSSDLVRAAKKRALVASIGGGGEGRDEVEVRIDGMIPRPGYTKGFRGSALFVGPEYVILRPFFDDPPVGTVREKVERVLIALGGDAAGVGIDFACLLADMRPDLRVDVLLGPQAPAQTNLPDRVICHRAVDNPRPVMERADVALISGGMTGYELMRLGIPMLFLPQVPHQLITSRAFEQAGVGFAYKGLAVKLERPIVQWLRDALHKLSPDDVRAHMAECGKALVDGGGLRRVAQILIDCTRSSWTAVHLNAHSEGSL